MTDRYAIRLAPPARRSLEDELPPGVAAAAWELISGPLAADPWRVGKHTIEIRTIRHRADAYRT